MELKPNGRYSPRLIHAPTELQAGRILARIGVDPHGIRAMLPKMRSLLIALDDVECRVANILKQEMLASGGDAAVHRESVACTNPSTDVLIMGTPKQIRRLAAKLAVQPFGLSGLSRSLIEILENSECTDYLLRTGHREMTVGKTTAVMGILNVTPDSFSDGGQFPTVDAAVQYGYRMAEEGADFIDVGGESSRPGADPVPADVELARILPVIEALHACVEVPVSVDTTKAEIARHALAAGAEIVNDISAMTYDPAMPAVVAESGAAVVLMHMRGLPKTMQATLSEYRSLPGDIVLYLKERLEAAQTSGIGFDRIIVDPGFGFGKSLGDNLALLNGLAELRMLGRPILAGVSRKSFVRQITGETLSASSEGTAAAIAAAAMNGAAIVRVHNVPAARKVVSMIDALKEART
ncbi:MAG TPA: dihydropteroate synthase [Syntrophales bacterium]|nr:dihydropteroate synthase [Syntrophales bacterium]HOS77294.1 dihydropteroate synthase [Syntrophales bacterium]